MRLRARVVAVGADAHWRFEYLRVEATDRSIGLMQIVIIERLGLRRRSQNGEKVASLRLVLAAIGFVGLADPAWRFGLRSGTTRFSRHWLVPYSRSSDGEISPLE